MNLSTVMELSIVAVALGIVRHVLDEFAVLAQRKSTHGALLAEDPGVQARYAESSATWGLVKAGVESLSRRIWRDALATRVPSQLEVGEVTASCALSIAKLRGSVSELMALAGMNAIQPDSELARAWRDLQALAAHSAVSPRSLTAIGATLLAASESLGR
jgi:two-component flavin-dependent monooxygenase